MAGPLSAECVADDDGCVLLPVTFPVQVSQCDSSGNLIQGPWVGAPPPGADPGDEYWPIVGAESLPRGHLRQWRHVQDGDPAAVQEREWRIRAPSGGSTWRPG